MAPFCRKSHTYVFDFGYEWFSQCSKNKTSLPGPFLTHHCLHWGWEGGEERLGNDTVISHHAMSNLCTRVTMPMATNEWYFFQYSLVLWWWFIWSPCTFRHSARDLQHLIRILVWLVVKNTAFYKLHAAIRLPHWIHTFTWVRRMIIANSKHHFTSLVSQGMSLHSFAFFWSLLWNETSDILGWDRWKPGNETSENLGMRLVKAGNETSESWEWG